MRDHALRVRPVAWCAVAGEPSRRVAETAAAGRIVADTRLDHAPTNRGVEHHSFDDASTGPIPPHTNRPSAPRRAARAACCHLRGEPARAERCLDRRMGPDADRRSVKKFFRLSLAAPLVLSLAAIARTTAPAEAIAVLSTAITPAGPGGTSGRLRKVAERAVRRVRLSPRWTVGGTAEDTTILLPLQLRATREHFLVYDGVAQRLLALTPASGRIAWRFGRPGRGPGEFGGVAKLTAQRDGGAFVVDFALSRMTAVSEEGTAGRRVEYRMGAKPAIPTFTSARRRAGRSSVCISPRALGRHRICRGPRCVHCRRWCGSP
jgi:hypothetical protein